MTAPSWPAWEDRPPQVEDRHRWGTPEHTEAHFRRFPHRRGMSGDAQRQDAQRTEGVTMNALRSGETCPTKLCPWPGQAHTHDPGRPVLPPIWRG